MDLVVDPTTEKPEERAVQIEETVGNVHVDNLVCELKMFRFTTVINTRFKT